MVRRGKLPRLSAPSGDLRARLPAQVSLRRLPPNGADLLRPARLPPAGQPDLIGREMDFECGCGRLWRERYLIEGELLGPSWILL
jgi:hypothetical protein